MIYCPDAASKQLERMYHARIIEFNEYRLAHMNIWYMYANFEGENHVVTTKTFGVERSQNANCADSLERRKCNHARQDRRTETLS